MSNEPYGYVNWKTAGLPIDNPKAFRHYIYQARVNRIAGFAILVLLHFLCVTVVQDWWALGIIPLAFVVGWCAYMILTLLVWMVVASFETVADYLSGN